MHSKATEAPDGIEITPDMFEAGARALAVFGGGYGESHATGAERVYRVMERARVEGLAAAILEIENSI